MTVKQSNAKSNKLDARIWSVLSAGQLKEAQAMARREAERNPAAALLATYYYLVGLDFKSAVFWNGYNPHAIHVAATWARYNDMLSMAQVGEFIFSAFRKHNARLSNVGFQVDFGKHPSDLTLLHAIQTLRKTPLVCRYEVKDQRTVALVTQEYEAYKAECPHDPRVVIEFKSKDMMTYEEDPEPRTFVPGIFPKG